MHRARRPNMTGSSPGQRSYFTRNFLGQGIHSHLLRPTQPSTNCMENENQRLLGVKSSSALVWLASNMWGCMWRRKHHIYASTACKLPNVVRVSCSSVRTKRTLNIRGLLPLDQTAVKTDVVAEWSHKACNFVELLFLISLTDIWRVTSRLIQ